MATAYGRRRQTRNLLRVSGVFLLAFSRALDTATTVPVLLVSPDAELNVIVRLTVAHFGVSGYVLASVLSIPAILAMVEILLWVDRRGGDRRFDIPESVIRLLAYAAPTIASVAAAIHNTQQLADALALPGVLA